MLFRSKILLCLAVFAPFAVSNLHIKPRRTQSSQRSIIVPTYNVTVCKNKVGAAFGSYGWSGENVKLIEEKLEKCVEFGRNFAKGLRSSE